MTKLDTLIEQKYRNRFDAYRSEPKSVLSDVMAPGCSMTKCFIPDASCRQTPPIKAIGEF